jgi:hypothetical protein
MADKIFTTNSVFTHILYSFFGKFIGKPSYRANDLAAQEKAGGQMTGVCYDAAKYLAQKIDGSFEYTAYWICGYGIRSILKWFSCNSLHSFLIVKIDGGYFFADCFMAPDMIGFDHNNRLCIQGFATEEEAIKFMVKNVVGNAPYMIRTFNPLTVKMGSHILYTIRRMLNRAD